MEKLLKHPEDIIEFLPRLAGGFPVTIVENSFKEKIFNHINYHYHNDFQFSLVTGGSFAFEVAGEKYYINEGEGIFINTNQIHRSESLVDNSKYIYIAFSPYIMTVDKDDYIYKKFIEPMGFKSAIPACILNREKSPEIIDLLENIYRLSFIRDDFFELLIVSKLYEILYRQLKILETIDKSSLTPDSLTNGRLRKIVKYVEDNYKDKITLRDLADEIGLSRSECSRLFKKNFGEGVFKYIINYRINEAVELIFNTDLNITEIPYKVGFNSQSYFIKVFKEIKGITPLKMRKKYR